MRLRILSLLTAEAMSAAEVARTLDLTHANASYHLRVLLDAGELVVESEEKIRGGVAKRYRYVAARRPRRATRSPQRRGPDRLGRATARRDRASDHPTRAKGPASTATSRPG